MKHFEPKTSLKDLFLFSRLLFSDSRCLFLVFSISISYPDSFCNPLHHRSATPSLNFFGPSGWSRTTINRVTADFVNPSLRRWRWGKDLNLRSPRRGSPDFCQTWIQFQSSVSSLVGAGFTANRERHILSQT